MQLLTVKQAAEILQISVGAVYALCASATLAHYRMGANQSAIRIDRAELLAYLQSCKCVPPKRAVDEPRSHASRRATRLKQTRLKHIRIDKIASPARPHV
jgi:excisionase family DNA binding protein